MAAGRPQDVKMVLLGDVGVGKSSLAVRLVKNEFNPNSETTVGAVCLKKGISLKSGQELNVLLWDTAGQERYHSLAPLYYRNAAVALIVYDITRKETFDTLKDWVKELKIQGPNNILIAIVGNKADLVSQREVPEETGRKFAKEVNGLFSETSAKMEDEHVHKFFISIGESLPSLPSNPHGGGSGGGQMGGGSAYMRPKQGNVNLSNQPSQPAKSGCC